MTSNPKEQILGILGISKDETILHEYKSFLVESLPILGTLYLTNNYICFYSDILFFNRNISIPLKEVTKISYPKPNIEIDTKTKTYSIFSKEEIDTILSSIKSVCKSYNNANKDKIDINPILIDPENSDDANENTTNSMEATSSHSTISNSPSKDSLLNQENIEEIDFEPIEPELDFEVCKKILDISPKDFFNKFYSESNKETDTQAFFDWAGDHSNVKISKWTKAEENESPEIEKFKKTESFSLVLHGVPMVDHSDVEKRMTYYIKKDGTYIIKISSITKGVPFADSFTIESKTELYPYNNGTKTIYRAYARTNFIKSVLLKGMLISQTKKSFKNEVNKWLEFIQLKGVKILGEYVSARKKIQPSNKDNLEMNKKDKMNKIVVISSLCLLISIILMIIVKKNWK